jgi:hypothetical protein
VDPYMTEPRPSMAKAVIIGGIVGGILGVIPLISSFNCCCCLWFAVGAIIAVLVYKAASPVSITTGHGALLGLITGVICGVISGAGIYAISGYQFRDPELYDPNSAKAQEVFDLFREMYSNAGMSDQEIEQILGQIESMMTSIGPEGATAYLVATIIFYIIIGVIISVLAGIITAAIAGKKQEFREEPPPYNPVDM